MRELYMQAHIEKAALELDKAHPGWYMGIDLEKSNLVSLTGHDGSLGPQLERLRETWKYVIEKRVKGR